MGAVSSLADGVGCWTGDVSEADDGEFVSTVALGTGELSGVIKGES